MKDRGAWWMWLSVVIGGIVVMVVVGVDGKRWLLVVTIDCGD